MPGFTSIINTLLRLLPNVKAGELVRAVSRIHPRSENLAEAAQPTSEFTAQVGRWHTRHAFEALSSWKWPFWLNAQVSPTSPSYIGLADRPALSNQKCRDAILIPGLHGVFAGTLDRRGMITPPTTNFSIEIWFRIGNKLFIPSEITDENFICYELNDSSAGIVFEFDGHRFLVDAGAHGNDEISFLNLKVKHVPVPSDQLTSVTIFYSVRPYHLESTVPLYDLVYNSRGFWMSDSRIIAWFTQRPDVSWSSDAQHGDAAFFIADPPDRTAVRCNAGMATAISSYHISSEQAAERTFDLVIPLQPGLSKTFPFLEIAAYLNGSNSIYKSSFTTISLSINGKNWLSKVMRNSHYQLCSNIDMSVAEVRDQFRKDNHWIVAAVRALIYQGCPDLAAKILRFAFLELHRNGYLAAGAGKWAFQGQALVALTDYYRLTRAEPDSTIATYSQIRSATRWIMRKRREVAHADNKPRGLLPPGITRSNTGTEYNLVDNAWCLEGLVSAGWLARHHQEHNDAEIIQRDAVRFAARISAAINRELEYGMSQLVPGRLHRAFDPPTASELLDLALMPEARRMLKCHDWMARLCNALYQEMLPSSPPQSSFQLRQIDNHGVYPARRLMLCLASLQVAASAHSQLLEELPECITPMGGWTECLDPSTKMGTGNAFSDPEAAALIPIIVKDMVIAEDEENQIVFRVPTVDQLQLLDGLTINNMAVLSGKISFSVSQQDGIWTISWDTTKIDPWVECFLLKPTHDTILLGAADQASGAYIV